MSARSSFIHWCFILISIGNRYLFITCSTSLKSVRFILNKEHLRARDTLRHYSSVEDKLFCTAYCVEETRCVAFGYNGVSRDCYLYEIDVTTAVLDPSTNTDIYIIAQTCGTPPSKQHASLVSPQTIYQAGAKVSYSCISGTFLSGSEEIRCQRPGEWQLPTFTCVAIQTCHHANQLGITVSSTLVIRPDINEPSFTVSCTSSSNIFYTVIGHSGGRTHVDGYEAAKSYIGTITYDLSMQDIVKVIDASAACEQFIKFECRGVEIQVDVGIRIRSGEEASYLIGGRKGYHDCTCYLTDSCDGGNRCNCNVNDGATWRLDEGYIRYKEDLPVTAMLVGDTGSWNEEAYYTVGNLQCQG